MKRKFQGLVMGTLIGVMCVGSTVYAKSGKENINVTYDNIKIFMDGNEVNPKDGNGQTVEPFIYNGTTYLPIRAVGNAIGKEVNWDGVEKVIYLGAKPGNVENWLDVCGPYQYKHGEEYKLTENEHFTMSGKRYTNGFVLNSHNDTAEALFNLNGKYNSVSFTVGHIDEEPNNNVTLNIYLDGVIAYTAEINYDDVAKKIVIPLKGALQMKIEIMNSNNGFVSGSAIYGFSEGEFK